MSFFKSGCIIFIWTF